MMFCGSIVSDAMMSVVTQRLSMSIIVLSADPLNHMATGTVPGFF